MKRGEMDKKRIFYPISAPFNKFSIKVFSNQGWIKFNHILSKIALVLTPSSKAIVWRCSIKTVLLKKKLWHRCFRVNFSTFLRAPFLQNTSWRLLLDRTCFIRILWNIQSGFFKNPFMWNCLWHFIWELHFSWNFNKPMETEN